jgi:hypothetical protein
MRKNARMCLASKGKVFYRAFLTPFLAIPDSLVTVMLKEKSAEPM